KIPHNTIQYHPGTGWYCVVYNVKSSKLQLIYFYYHVFNHPTVLVCSYHHGTFFKT
ncbi:unnamed protein product, partial [Linum tenue]